MRMLTLSVFVIGMSVLTPVSRQNPYLGRWNLTGTGPDSANVYWLEIKEEGGQLTGMFLNRSGNPNPLGLVKIENGELIFQAGRPGQLTGPEYRARLEGARIIGQHTVTQGGRGRATDPTAPPPPPPTQRVVNWIGVRPPQWPIVNANARHSYAAPVVLFDGKSLGEWDVQIPSRPMGWSVVEGLLINEAGANNIISRQKFMDFKIEAEFKLADKSNSGIYLRGRYELQVLDDYASSEAAPAPDRGHMAIYGRTAPAVKASKPAGEWQTMEAIVVANRVTVTLNGQRVHDNAVIEGITGGALDNDETSPGPILLQGDHGKIWFRKLVVTPIRTLVR